ncbi:FAD-dependent oxidoreductase [Tsukamurella sp. PLM1]|uniref:FAD-dependent oxidoreductase n=1 Tax=Tsukamurella sp. PLM1 TaxID=2929795 RepID=UPI002059FBC9|nr:hypothetical protein MTP03_42260 [Tsukamurella sp. PLM1]
MQQSVSVVGGGTVGLTVAWTLARRGAAVTVLDPEPGSGASWVAGGMIAPYSEAWPGEEALYRLGVESLDLWEAFARDLQPYADGPLVTARGTVWLAVDDGDAEDLATIAAAVGDPELFGALRPSAALRAVPGAAPRIRAAARAPRRSPSTTVWCTARCARRAPTQEWRSGRRRSARRRTCGHWTAT